MHDPEGVEAEEFLWSLGVGEALPEWLKDLRAKERNLGLNQKPRVSPGVVTRPGIGPQRAWSGADGADNDSSKQVTPSPAPTPLSHLGQQGQKSTPSSASAAPLARSPAPAAAARSVPTATATVTQAPAPAATPKLQELSKERRIDPDDGKSYSLDELLHKYAGMFSEEEIKVYFNSDCTPVVEAPKPAPVLRSEEPIAAPTPKAAEAIKKKFDITIKDWLSSLDDSGFLIQYHDGIAAKLDSLEQLVDIYVKEGGEVDSQLFVDVGIKKLGHKRLFEKWFRENCGPGRAARA